MNRTSNTKPGRWLPLGLVTSFLVGSALLGMGCDKPTEAECKQAVSNVRRIAGTDKTDLGVSDGAAIRSCRGNATKASVKCAIEAQTIEDLRKCTGGISEKLLGDDVNSGSGSAAPAAPAGDTATPAPAVTPPPGPVDPAAATPPPGAAPSGAAAVDPAAATPPPGSPAPSAVAPPATTPPPAAAPPAPSPAAPTAVPAAPADPAAATPPPQ